MSIQVSQANLVDAHKQLRTRWLHIRQSWSDDAARQFEKEFIEPLEQRVLAAVRGLDHVAETMAQARRDCSDDAGGML